MNRNLWRIYRDAAPANAAGGGSILPAGGQTQPTQTPPAGGQTQPTQTPPAGGATPPLAAIDPNVISAAARTEMARSLGFSSVEEMKTYLAQTKSGRKKPPAQETVSSDIKELQQKVEIYQKTSDEIRQKYKKTLIENAFHSAFNQLGMQVHSIDDLKSIILNSLDVIDDDKIIIKNATGDVMLNQKGERLSISEHIGKILTEKPWLVKTNIKPGTGVFPGRVASASDGGVTLEELVKKESMSLQEFQAAMGEKKK